MRTNAIIAQAVYDEVLNALESAEEVPESERRSFVSGYMTSVFNNLIGGEEKQPIIEKKPAVKGKNPPRVRASDLPITAHGSAEYSRRPEIPAKILDYLNEGPASRAEIVKVLAKKKSTTAPSYCALRTVLRNLETSGKIEMIGYTSGARYALAAPNENTIIDVRPTRR